MINKLKIIIILSLFLLGCSKDNKNSQKFSSENIVVSKKFSQVNKFEKTFYIYLVNRDKNSVSRCVLNENNGLLMDCIITGGSFFDPIGITIVGDHAFITNNKKWSDSGSITICKIEKMTGSLSNCFETAEDLKFNNIAAITNRNGFIYVASQNNGITRCLINLKNGTISNCHFQATGIKSFGLTIANNHLYMTNSEKDIINKCLINSDDSIGTCSPTKYIFEKPNGVHFYKGVAYIVAEADNKVYKCNLNADGAWDSCSATGADNYYSPRSVNIINGFAYVTSLSSGKVTICKVNDKNANFENCSQYSDSNSFGLLQEATASFVYTPADPDLLVVAYLASATSNKVYYCMLDLFSTSLKNCKETGSGFQAPSALAIKEPFLYAGNKDKASITKCQISLEKGLSNCSNINLNPEYLDVRDIKIVNNYFYFTSYKSNNIVKCNFLESSGEITNCSQVYALQNPRAIEFKDQNAYITSGDKRTTVSICDYDFAIGNIANCRSSVSFKKGWAPTLIDILTPSKASFIYLSNDDNILSRCLIRPSGELSDCRFSEAEIQNPQLVKYFADQIYILSHETAKISVCQVNSKNGLLSHCNEITNEFVLQVGNVKLNNLTFSTYKK